MESQSPPFIVIGNMMWNAGLIGALGYMIRLWMKTTEGKIDSFFNQNREDHKEIFTKIENHSERIAVVEDRTKKG